jgi:hypothetical protein
MVRYGSEIDAGPGGAVLYGSAPPSSPLPGQRREGWRQWDEQN